MEYDKECTAVLVEGHGENVIYRAVKNGVLQSEQFATAHGAYSWLCDHMDPPEEYKDGEYTISRVVNTASITDADGEGVATVYQATSRRHVRKFIEGMQHGLTIGEKFGKLAAQAAMRKALGITP